MSMFLMCFYKVIKKQFFLIYKYNLKWRSYLGRSNFMMNYYKNYKEELEEIDERSKSFKPKPWWAYGLFYCYLIFYGYIFWMEPLAIPV